MLDYFQLQLERSADTSKSRSSYRGFSSGHGILRLHVREAFIPEHCPLANPSTMNYLHRALPNCPPPDMEMSVESDEPSNILIAAIIHRTPTNVSYFLCSKVNCVTFHLHASHFDRRPCFSYLS